MQNKSGPTYSCLAGSCGLVEFLAAERSALVQSDAELVARRASSIHVHAGGIVHVARRVDDSLEGSVEHDDRPDEIVGALGRNVCCACGPFQASV